MDTNFIILTSLCSIILFFLIVITFLFAFSNKDNLFKNNWFSKLKIGKKNKTKNLELKKIKEILFNALMYFSQKKIGSLIVFEKENSLSQYINNGFKINSDISFEFIISVFSNKSVSFHDGALIISKNKIISISSYLPICKKTIDIKYGARHRAAIGITEITDSIVFVTSEMSGEISFAISGQLFNLEKDSLKIKSTIERLL